MLKQQLQEQLKQAMLSQDTDKKSILRLLLSAIGYFETEKGGAGYEATDEDVLNVIDKQAKQRKDSIEQFEKARRSDLADIEKKELQFLQTFLPSQMSEEEIKKLVMDAITQTDAKNIQDMGKVMAALMPKTKGKADGGMVSKIVREELSHS